jgi:hypothetical protein
MSFFWRIHGHVDKYKFCNAPTIKSLENIYYATPAARPLYVTQQGIFNHTAWYFKASLSPQRRVVLNF